MRSVSGCSNLISACSADADGSSAAVFMPLFCATQRRTANLSFVASALRGEIEIAPMQQLDLPARAPRVAAVVDDVVRGFQSRRAIRLARAASPAPPRVGIASRRIKRSSCSRLGAVDDEHRDRRARRSSSRRAAARRRAAYGAVELARACARVRCRISGCRIASSVAPLRVVREDERAQRRAVRARRTAAARAGPKASRDGGEPGLAGRDDLAGDDVRVDERGAELRRTSSPTSDLPLAMPPVRPTTSAGLTCVVRHMPLLSLECPMGALTRP